MAPVLAVPGLFSLQNRHEQDEINSAATGMEDGLHMPVGQVVRSFASEAGKWSSNLANVQVFAPI